MGAVKTGAKALSKANQCWTPEGFIASAAGGLSGLLETAGQLAQARLGLPFQVLLLVSIALEGLPDLRQEVRGEGEDTGFALGAEGQSGRAVGFAARAAAGGFAAAATQGNERAAQEESGSAWFGGIGGKWRFHIC